MSVVLFIGGGILLDRLLERSPVFTLIGVVLALVAAGYELYELTRVGRAGVEAGPLTRGIARVAPARRGEARSRDRANEE